MAPSSVAPFETSDNENKEDLKNNKKSLVELPDQKIEERTSTPPERRSKTQMKLKIPTLDLEKVATAEAPNRLDYLAKTDRKKLELL